MQILFCWIHIILWKCFTTKGLVNIIFPSHNCHFFVVSFAVVKVRILKLHSQSSVPVRSTLLLTVVTMLPVTRDVTYCSSGTCSSDNSKFVSFHHHFPIPHPFPSLTVTVLMLPWVFCFSNSMYVRSYTVFVFLHLTFYTFHNAFNVCLCSLKQRIFFRFTTNCVTFLCVYIYPIFYIHPSINRHLNGYCFGYFEKCYNEYESADVFLKQWFHSLQLYLEVRFLDHMVIYF